MIFIDSSALIKKYVREPGSESVIARLESGAGIFVSQITFAECLSAFARKRNNREMSTAKFERACDDFIWDWMVGFNKIEVDSKTMASVRELVLHLRAADAIQLSCALWLRDLARFAPERAGAPGLLEFVATDSDLLRAARAHGLRVFNPEETP